MSKSSLLGGLTFSWAFIAVGLMVVSWTMATPLGAAPDEPDQIIQAAAMVRGEFAVPHPAHYPLSTVKVPLWIRNTIYLPNCFAFRPDIPDGCPQHIGTGSESVQATTQFSNYPPLYFLIAGIPSLLGAGPPSIYAMRLVGVLVNSALIALGLTMLARFHPHRLVLVGALVALSPMVLFAMAVVSDSGLETAAGFAAWCCGLCVIEHQRTPRTLAWSTGMSFVLLILSRPFSPLNAAIVISVLLILAGVGRLRTLFRDPGVRVVLIAALLAVLWAIVSVLLFGTPSEIGAPLRPSLDLAGSIWLTLRQTGARLRETIGIFGWLDTPVPVTVVWIWSVAVGGLSLFGLVTSARCRRALPLLAVGILVMPVVIEAPRTDSFGLVWQGRYWLPLAVGIPLVASACHDWNTRRYRGLTAGRWAAIGTVAVTWAALGSAQLIAFLWALRRYQVGLAPPAGARAHWSPPGGGTLSIDLLVLGEVLLLPLLLWLVTEMRRRRTTIDETLEVRSA